MNSSTATATLYLSGTFLHQRHACAACRDAARCNFAGWNPNKDLFMVVANGSGGQVNPGDSI